MRKPPFDKPFANYGLVLGIGIVFFALSGALPTLLNGQVIMPRNSVISKDEFIGAVGASYMMMVAVCLALSLIWLYASEHVLKIDWKGTHTQLSWWLIFLFFATLTVPGVGYGLTWPSVQAGGAFAFALLFGCALAQFWVGTLLASPNPQSVAGGGLLRRTGVV